MSKRTPGRWRLRASNRNWVESDSGAEIAVVMERCDRTLIAAAPDLLAVCERIQQAILSDQDLDLWAIPPPVEDALRAAIARAHGEGE